jgi:hypothetical protein
MVEIDEFDRTVGKISGALFAEVFEQYPCAPLTLVPGLTFKVRKAMESVNFKKLSLLQKAELAKDIRVSVVPLLFCYDVSSDVIEKIAPRIESAALKSMTD